MSLLTEGLVKENMDVTLYATGDSVTSAKLRGVCARPYEEDREIDPKVWECLHISALMEQAEEYDIIHNHYDFLPLSYSGLIDTPMVTTIHGFSSPKILPVYRKYNQKTHYVSISDADRHPDLRYIRDGLSWDRSGELRVPARSRRVSGVLRVHSSGQRHTRGDRGGQAGRHEAAHRRDYPGPGLL
ncbi:glycosyltransferase [Paenibacillus mucilaginosus KNP414]|uniref:Glycosyltransferase n=1 Tax=Paenibacillus mucilaginosus (strain KNP414) TaxID=1036673 RepID=F8FN74_PAEMK|nr:glycosyltransferase [Paenibacillus mucilaginosus KNP414]